MDPSSAERVLATALRYTAAALGDRYPAAGSPSVPPASVVSGHSRGIAEGGKPAAEGPSTLSAIDLGSSCGARAPGMGVAAAALGGSAAHGAGVTCVVMILRRDVGNAAQARVLREDARPPVPRLPPQNCRPVYTRGMASLDGSRCVVIVDTGADVSLVSARALRPGVKYLHSRGAMATSRGSARKRHDIRARGSEGAVGFGPGPYAFLNRIGCGIRCHPGRRFPL